MKHLTRKQLKNTQPHASALKVHLDKHTLVASIFELATMEPFNSATVILEDGLHTMQEVLNQLSLTYIEGLPDDWEDDMTIDDYYSYLRGHSKVNSKTNSKAPNDIAGDADE